MRDTSVEIIKSLVDLPSETEWVEFKTNHVSPDKMGQLISGLANSASYHEQEHGYVVFGIRDDTHAIVGSTYKPKSEKVGNADIENWWHQRLNPKIDFSIEEGEISGKRVVLFKIPAAIDRPIEFSNIPYIRIGSSNRKLSDFPRHAQRIWNNWKYKNIEITPIKDGLSAQEVLGSLNYPEYFKLTNQPLPSNSDLILSKLAQDDLIRKRYKTFDITYLGALLFAHDLNLFPPLRRKVVRVILYKSNNRISTIKEEINSKGYAISFPEVVKFVTDQLPSNEVIEQVFRVERKMYPQIALREIIANALIHQDLTVDGMSPMIEIFEDRIEVSNPGIPLIDTDRFIDNTPRSRNESLASFMRRIKVCEERGSGIDKVINAVELYQLPAPHFETNKNSTRVTVFAYKELKDMSKSDKVRACYQHCVLKFVSNQYMTNTSLRKRFDIADQNYSIASRIIADTVAAKLVKLAEVNSSKRHSKYIPAWA